MSIQNLFHGDPSRGIREAGQIRLGLKEEGKNYPTKLDYFVILRPDPATGEMKPDLDAHKKVGTKPKSLRIFLAGETPEDCFYSSLDLYRARGKPRFCSGDNQQAQVTMFPQDRCAVMDGELVVQRRLSDGWSKEPARKLIGSGIDLSDLEEDKEASEKAGFSVFQCVDQAVKIGPVGCPCDLLGGDGNIKCKPHGILRVFLKSVGGLGAFHVFRTTSWNSIRGITASLQMIYQLTGRLAGLELLLKCQKKKVQTPDGKSQSVTVAHIESPWTIEELMERAKELAITRHETVQVVQALPRAKNYLDEPRVVEEVTEEFHPEMFVEPETAPEEETQEPERSAEEPDEPFFGEEEEEVEHGEGEEDPFAAAGL